VGYQYGRGEVVFGRIDVVERVDVVGLGRGGSGVDGDDDGEA
jgi:hypothetical protein